MVQGLADTEEVRVVSDDWRCAERVTCYLAEPLPPDTPDAVGCPRLLFGGGWPDAEAGQLSQP